IKKMEPRLNRRGSFCRYSIYDCMTVKVHYKLGIGKFIILSIGDLIEIETIIEETLYNTIIIRY
ncbi:TPA: hypothetical protein ACOFYO_002802, partial [Staphylococcus aureus]